jgi:hypothetical protein
MNEWVKDILDYKKYLTIDQQIVVDAIGLENLIKLCNIFGKSFVYFGSLNNLKKAYVLQNEEIPGDILSDCLKVSPKTIYNWRKKSIAERQKQLEGK